MSPWTKRLQRSTRNFAPFSGVLLHCASAFLTQMNGPTAAPAVTAAVDCRNLRRLNSLIASSFGCGRLLILPRNSRDEPLAAHRVENVGPREIGREVNPIPRTAVGPILDRRRHVLAIETAIELRVGSGRLDDDHFHRQARRAQRTVLRAHSVEHLAA